MDKPKLQTTAIALVVAGSMVGAGAVLAQTAPQSPSTDTRVYMEDTGKGSATALAPPNGSVTPADVVAARAELPPRADRN